MYFQLSNRNFCALIVLVSFWLTPLFGYAATLRIVPPGASVSKGETLSVVVTVTSSDQAMNATEGVLKFPSDLLRVIAVSKGGSVLGLWIQEPTYSNAAGTVNFEGVALNPGYVGSNGTVITVTFQALQEGVASLSLIGGSVLANDGNGTEILTGTTGSAISISEAVEKPQAPSRQETKPLQKPEIKPVPLTEVPVPVEEIPLNAPNPKITVEKPFDASWIFARLGTPGGMLLAFLVVLFAVLDALLLAQYLRMRKREGGELEHAQVLTHRSFLLLRDDIDKFVNELEEESGKRSLSGIEAHFVKEMRSDLSNAEKSIVKELRETEKHLS